MGGVHLISSPLHAAHFGEKVAYIEHLSVINDRALSLAISLVFMGWNSPVLHLL